MRITQLAVGNQAIPLGEGEALQLAVGDTLRVFYGFNYKVAETTDIQVRAALYRYTAGILDRSPLALTTETITLDKALTFQPYSGEIDIVIGQVGSGLWGLICELPDYDVEQHLDDCLDVTAPPSMMDMIGPILILGLMAAMIPMIAEEV